MVERSIEASVAPAQLVYNLQSASRLYDPRKLPAHFEMQRPKDQIPPLAQRFSDGHAQSGHWISKSWKLGEQKLGQCVLIPIQQESWPNTKALFWILHSAFRPIDVNDKLVGIRRCHFG
jgi:hypothetical protein